MHYAHRRRATNAMCITAMVKPIALTEKEKSLPQGDRLFI
jgi:hypothetical protein